MTSADAGSRLLRIAVIPAHDEAATIAKVVIGAGRHVDQVLVVDDGSSDETADRAREAGAWVVRHEQNRGKGAALDAGFERACAAGALQLVTLDADGEHDVDEIPLLIDALGRADLVLGHRRVYRSRVRAMLNHFATFWFRLLEPSILDTTCGYRALRASAVPSVRNGEVGFAYEHEMLLRAVMAGLSVAAVPVSIHSNASSHVTLMDLVAANNHFDRRVLGALRQLRLSWWRKVVLAVGCTLGLLIGLPVELVLRVRAREKAARR